MPKATILFADNKSAQVDWYKSILEGEGYRVIPAYNYEEACRKLKQTRVSLAILDLHMIDDEDENDFSGLDIARESDPAVPKIILTVRPSLEAQSLALKHGPSGLPPAVEFVVKESNASGLLNSIQDALGPDLDWMRSVLNALHGADQDLDRDYRSAQEQARLNFRTSLGISLLGAILAFTGISFGWQQKIDAAWISAVAGVLVEVVSLLFFRRVDRANDRMDDYHRERLQGKRLEILLDACEGFRHTDDRESCRKEILLSAARLWLDGLETKPNSPSPLPGTEG